MKHSRIQTSYPSLVAAAAWLMLACGGPDGDFHELTEEASAILGGEPSSLAEFPATGWLTFNPNPGGPPIVLGRECTATRVAPNAVLTAAHCIGPLAAAHYGFGQGDHTLLSTGYPRRIHQSALEVVKLSPTYDLALLRTAGCSRSWSPLGGLAQSDGAHYTFSSFLHENNTRDGAARKITGVDLIEHSATRLRSTIQCAEASVWGGDSGSPIYDTSASAIGPGPRPLVGVATSVGGFCQNGATTQTIFYWRVDGAAGQAIRAVLQAWAPLAGCGITATTSDRDD